MKTVNEVSKLTGISVRTLHHYDAIGLLKPAKVTEAGYRLYDDAALSRLQRILLFRELRFSLKEIKEILDKPDFDESRALDQQITLLTMQKERLEKLIAFAREMKTTGGKKMDFSAFDREKLDEYAKQAKESWGSTPQYKEFEEKNSGRSAQENQDLGGRLMAVIAEFGALKAKTAADPAVQRQVKKLQDFITEHYYTCTDVILSQLGLMYAAGGEFTANIDAAGGSGTAAFIKEAIDLYCRERRAK